MFQSSFRIYITANVLIYCLVAVWLFPEGLAFGLVAIIVSLLLSLPVLFVLLISFFLVHKYSPGLLARWLLLALVLCFSVLIPPFFITRGEEFIANRELFYISTGLGFGAVLLQSFYLHKYFKSLHHENN